MGEISGQRAMAEIVKKTDVVRLDVEVDFARELWRELSEIGINEDTNFPHLYALQQVIWRNIA